MQLGLPVELAKCERSFLFAGEKSKESDSTRALKRFWASVSFCFFFLNFILFFATVLLSVNFNCSFHLITSLTGSFSSVCWLFPLLLGPSASNVYLLEQRSLHLLTMSRNQACVGGKTARSLSPRQLFKMMERCLSWLVSKLSAEAWFCIHVRIRSCSMFCA